MLLSGCSIYDLPLPGGAKTGDNPQHLTLMFRDVLDLVPQSTVKVDDVTVGKVKAIKLKGYVAEVKVEIPRDVKLPANTTAQIRQTSLLGEKFIALDRPENASSATLSDNAVIGLDRTGRNPEVEEVFSALALLLNGGGVGQLKTIVSELNNTMSGREDDVRSVLTQIRTFMGQLDQNKTAVVAAIENTNRLAAGLRSQDTTIKSTLDDLPRALASINSQRADLVKLLKALTRLSGVGVNGDPGVQGLDDQQPPRARSRARRLRQGREELPRVLPGLPDLPVRGRRRRSRPAGGPQPAHG